MSLLNFGDDVDDIKKFVKEGIKDVIKPIYKDLKHDINTVEKKN